MMRTLRFATVAVACTAALLAPVAAYAHAVLVSSTPAAHQVLPRGPLHVVLRFNSRVDGKRSTVELADAHGAARQLVLSAGGGPDALEADAGELAPGSYLLRWQALASDGHITRGQIPFDIQ